MKIIEKLIKFVRDAAVFNPEVQAAPACILWPDHERQWEEIIPNLLKELPELLILGEYNPEIHTGPGIWLRCVIAGKNDGLEIPNGRVPIIYLPGVSRQDLRVVMNYPDYLKPLAELQYRGVIWSQVNDKDWTILSFLMSGQGGLGLDVALDNETKKATQRALTRLLDEEVELLKDKRLDKDYFNTLLTGGDPVRDLLQWLDQGDAFQNGRSESEWKAFVEVCKSKFGFNPEKDGVLTGAAKLATHDMTWSPVWERFCEAPKRYLNIPDQIRKCKRPSGLSWYNPDQSDYDGWPQWNEEQENELRKQLQTLGSVPPHEARKKIVILEKEHGSRRNLVWTELGEASLAQAMEHLSVLAKITTNALAAGTIDDLATGYQNSGWQADDAVIRALNCVDKQEDLEFVKTTIRAIYKPWAEESARYMQKIVDGSGYPGGNAKTLKTVHYKDGECIFFVDGLRFDIAKRFVTMLKDQGYEIEEKLAWAALPSVTATGKPAVTPVHNKIYGNDTTTDFEPCIVQSGQSVNDYNLKKLLKDAGWEIEPLSKVNVNGNAWYEFGNIDHKGHEQGWELAKSIEEILSKILERVMQLLEIGWNRVHIVTDHGWLLLPGNLPKIELSSAQTETRWGRCASIKPGASASERLYPWYWDPNQHFALADGISCFKNGMEYAHGGVSLQECLTLELIVTSGSSNISQITSEITEVVWKRLTCTATIDGRFEDRFLDVRTQPGNSSSSIVASVKALKSNGTALVVVEDEDLEGTKATIVLINSKGDLVAQIDTIIGGG